MWKWNFKRHCSSSTLTRHCLAWNNTIAMFVLLSLTTLTRHTNCSMISLFTPSFRQVETKSLLVRSHLIKFLNRNSKSDVWKIYICLVALNTLFIATPQIFICVITLLENDYAPIEFQINIFEDESCLSFCLLFVVEFQKQKLV